MTRPFGCGDCFRAACMLPQPRRTGNAGRVFR